MNKAISLIVEPRKFVGHQAKKTRKSGKIPGTLYGRGMKSISIDVPKDTFVLTYKQAGETHLLDLSCDGKIFPALIHHVQKNPVTQQIVHAEFLTVSLTEKLKTQVPVQVIGIAPAVKEGRGTLLITLNNVEIETLPNAIPEGIDVDISSMDEVNSEVKVKHMKIPQGVTLLTDPEMTVAKIGAIVVEAQPLPEATAPTEETKTETTEETKQAPETTEETK
jgi:large subunit ribosomal protein L25